jgi:hypothetical protein
MMSRMARPRRPIASPAPIAPAEPLIRLAGRIVAVTPADQAVFCTPDGREIPCRCPQHVNVGWLRAALARGPVEAEIAAASDLTRGSVWALFPGPEHDDVAADTLELRAGSRLKLACGDATLTLTKEGKSRLRGREVTMRGSRVARVVGGVVKIN